MKLIKTILFEIVIKWVPPSGVGATVATGLFLLCQMAFGQQDTLFVNAEGTSYLIFDEPISLYNLGSKDYEAKADNPKILFLKAKYPNTKTSTLIVTHGEQILTAYIAYKAKSQAFYDFRKPVASVQTLKESNENEEQKQVKNNLQKVNQSASNILIESKKQQIILKLTHLFNDNQATYLRFILENQSSILYDLDYVSFAYIEKAKKKKRKYNSVNSGYQDVEPLIKVEQSITESGKSNSYSYALPLYSTTEAGILQVIFREKAGLRSISLDIPFKKILNSTLLNQQNNGN